MSHSWWQKGLAAAAHSGDVGNAQNSAFPRLLANRETIIIYSPAIFLSYLDLDFKKIGKPLMPMAVSQHFVKSNCPADSTIKVRADVELTRHLGWFLHHRRTGRFVDVWWCFCKCSVRCLLLVLSCEFSWTSYLGRIGTYNHVHCNNLTVILMHLDHLDHPPHPALRTPRDVAMPTMFRKSLAGAIPMLCGDIVAKRPTNFQPSQFSPCIAKCNNVHLPNHCSGTTRTRQYRPLLFKSLLGAPASRITKCRWCCLWQFNFLTWANENGSVSFFCLVLY